MERSGEVKLTKESIEHLVRLSTIIKLFLENHVELFLELLNVLSDLWWHQMSQLGIELGRRSHFLLYVQELYEVFRVERWQLTRCRLFFVVDCFVVIMCLSEYLIHFSLLVVHVLDVHLASLISELTSLSN